MDFGTPLRYNQIIHKERKRKHVPFRRCELSARLLSGSGLPRPNGDRASVRSGVTGAYHTDSRTEGV